MNWLRRAVARQAIDATAETSFIADNAPRTPPAASSLLKRDRFTRLELSLLLVVAALLVFIGFLLGKTPAARSPISEAPKANLLLQPVAPEPAALAPAPVPAAPVLAARARAPVPAAPAPVPAAPFPPPGKKIPNGNGPIITYETFPGIGGIPAIIYYDRPGITNPGR